MYHLNNVVAIFFLIWPIWEARAEIRAGKKVPTWANSALVKVGIFWPPTAPNWKQFWKLPYLIQMQVSYITSDYIFFMLKNSNQAKIWL